MPGYTSMQEGFEKAREEYAQSALAMLLHELPSAESQWSNLLHDDLCDSIHNGRRDALVTTHHRLGRCVMEKKSLLHCFPFWYSRIPKREAMIFTDQCLFREVKKACAGCIAILLWLKGQSLALFFSAIMPSVGDQKLKGHISVIAEKCLEGNCSNLSAQPRIALELSPFRGLMLFLVLALMLALASLYRRSTEVVLRQKGRWLSIFGASLQIVIAYHTSVTFSGFSQLELVRQLLFVARIFFALHGAILLGFLGWSTFKDSKRNRTASERNSASVDDGGDLQDKVTAS